MSALPPMLIGGWHPTFRPLVVLTAGVLWARYLPPVFVKCNFRIHQMLFLVKSFNFLDSQYVEALAPASEEVEEEVKKKISENFFYDYTELISMPFVTPDSNIPLDLLTLVYPLQLHVYSFWISAS